jgi:serine/threonine-protein kinase
MITCPTCQSNHDDALAFCPNDGTSLRAGGPLVGKVLGDRYKVIARIGEGGMGTVYLAEHVMLGKRMAVKVLREEFSAQEELIKRFQLEAVAASQIGQENIVNVTDFGRTPEGQLYFVMELLEGESLAAIIRRDGAISVERSLPILAQICKALAAAHSRGIIHRDLKPDNVVVIQKDERIDFVKVLDFGISKAGESPGVGRLTQVGMMLGTPEYMAPEQARGAPVDARADVYAFGVLAYEMVTGSLPFLGETPVATLMKHQNEQPQPPGQRRPDLGIPEELEKLILKALSKNASTRHQGMGEVATDLSRCMGRYGMGPVTTPVNMSIGGGRGTPSHPILTPVPSIKTPKGTTMQLTEAEVSGKTPLPALSGFARVPTNPAAQSLPEQVATAMRNSSRGQAMGAEGAGAGGKGTRIAAAAAIVAVLGLAGWLATRGPGAPEVAHATAAPPTPTPNPTTTANPTTTPTPTANPTTTANPNPTTTTTTTTNPPAEAPAPAPQKVAHRKVWIRTVPSGATVTGPNGLRATTPTQIEIADGTQASYRLTLPGFRPENRRVSSQDGDVEVRLSRAEARRPKREAKPSGESTEELKPNPFD